MKISKQIINLINDFDQAVYENNKPEIERLLKELDNTHKTLEVYLDA
jgi:hypothetical protein